MTPRSDAEFERLRVESRDRIERAALRVFAERGLEAATVREIAREAGVSQGLLYNYYPGKQELLAALFRRGMRDVDASLAAGAPDAAAGGDGAAALRRFAAGAMAIVREHLDYWRISYMLRWQPGVPEALRGELDAWTARIVAALAAHVGGAGPGAEARARLLFAAVDGVAQHYALDPEGYPLDAVLDALAATFAPRVTAAPG
ncbi:TetR/AcrR family transcriptional regulator [Roseisolibacter sp. H3M3-2]|uniref:TetR/AcrR family transcriptional regulator n=1 Tax=Roseisolibacter sp. H3M3-2 TaxID=3031323 RepID=UPI0023D984C2|nr:TetR/AcrR family transcriptional regulator [Roseisolibacter sp. H3M3-2]MDF1502229.1 helix-turn-helix domain containing protein [Roseisolibacter sp. H3M3-2]